MLLLLWSLHDAPCTCGTGCVTCRCLDTASIVLADMQLTNVNTEELIRETLGSDTCDARRSVSDPAGGGKPDTGPCAFDRGLKSKCPAYDFPGRSEPCMPAITAYVESRSRLESLFKGTQAICEALLQGCKCVMICCDDTFEP